jgi:2-keto-4-pentenoate hydratase/2-oxohepta-3-ene-1,7-dioic acid hydratase in catechol pathway
MKLLRHGKAGEERPGLVDNAGRGRDLSGVVPDISPETLDPATLTMLRAIDPETLPLLETGVRLGPCVGSVRKVIGVGQNYHDFVARAGLPVPTRPVLFLKPPSSLCGPDDDIILPAHATQADWEAELGIVFGQTASNVSADDAMNHVAGFCVVNDITERGWIAESGQLLNGKGADTFTPVGPWLVTADEIHDPQNLGIYLERNETRWQDGSTADMIFNLRFLISHISRFMTLLPGDILATGTPAGVGARATPPEFLRPGDTLRLGVEHLGEQCSRVIASAA